MGKKIIIKNVKFGLPYYGAILDKKLPVPVVLLLQYHTDKHFVHVSVLDYDDIRSKSLDGRTIRLDDAACVIENGIAKLDAPLYKKEMTLSVMGRFYKLLPQSDDPGAERAEKLLNMLSPANPKAGNFLGTGMDALRVFSELKGIWG